MDYKKLYEQTLAEKKDLEHKLAICEAEQEEESNLYEKTLDENKRLERQIFGVHTGVLQVEGLIDQLVRVGKENDDLKKKSDAKSDIIKNLMDVIMRKANIDDGFYIHREWGHKYIDEWNKIVTEELKQAVEDINYMDEFRLETDGYQFDFCPSEEEE
jgi:hypothetical protein